MERNWRQYERNSDWIEAQVSAEENRFIDENGWEALAEWRLVYEPR